MKIAEKKALRMSTEELAQKATALHARVGKPIEVAFDEAAIEGVDPAGTRYSLEEVLGKLGYVAGSIVDAMVEMADDDDYREAFGELSAIRFTPARDLAGDDFDYESSVQVDGSVMQISYAPMAYMHGGYERALRNAF
ncbi:MAG: hypothetical protein KC621_10000 [Myxococcales bacterium]|nr:hypothetical protein [Myxococcales bacterium]